MIELNTLPIKLETLRVAFAGNENQSGPVLVGNSSINEYLYVLRGYATCLLVDDVMFGARRSMIENRWGWQPSRLPGCIGLSDGGHSLAVVQQVLDKHVDMLEQTVEDEFLLGPADLPDSTRFKDFKYDDELGIYRRFDRTGLHLWSRAPRRR